MAPIKELYLIFSFLVGSRILCLITVSIAVAAELQPYSKKGKIIINIDHAEYHTSLFLTVVDHNLFKTQTFTKGLEKLMFPGIKPPPTIVEQITTLKGIYTDLNSLFDRRNKILGSHVLKADPCQVTYQIFSNSFATHIINELLLTVADLPDPTTDLTTNQIQAKKASALLMQALLDLNKIYLYLNNEILELENVVNHMTTPHTFQAIQNSLCIDKLANEKLHILNTKASTTGLMIYINVVQYKHSLHTYSLIPTPYFGFVLNLTNVFLIEDKLAKCSCIYEDSYVHTGCACLPLEENCNKAIENNNVLLILDSCSIIPEQNTGPQTTLTGVLFPTYSPFTLPEADIDHALPPPSFPLLFHLTSSKRFKITYQGRKLLFQAASADSTDSVELPNITAEDLQEIKLKLSPLFRVSTGILGYGLHMEMIWKFFPFPGGQ